MQCHVTIQFVCSICGLYLFRLLNLIFRLRNEMGGGGGEYVNTILNNFPIQARSIRAEFNELLLFIFLSMRKGWKVGFLWVFIISKSSDSNYLFVDMISFYEVSQTETLKFDWFASPLA